MHVYVLICVICAAECSVGTSSGFSGGLNTFESRQRKFTSLFDFINRGVQFVKNLSLFCEMDYVTVLK